LSRDQINIRCEHEMKMYLMNLGDYSKYVRDLIEKDWLTKRDPVYLKQKETELKEKLKEIQELQKTPQILSNYQDIISEFNQDPEKPEIIDSFSRTHCYKYFKTKYWPRIKNLPEYKLKNPVEVFNKILE